MVYPGYQPHLFDLNEDPDELNNLSEIMPDIVKTLDIRLREIVDYEKVDKKVKDYDKECFCKWRNEHIKTGDYRELMGRIFSGWDYMVEGEGNPWTDQDEQAIVEWIKK